MRNKPITKGQTLQASTSMRYLKYQIHRDKKQNDGYQKPGDRGLEAVEWYGASVWEDEEVLEVGDGNVCMTTRCA